MHSRHVSFGLAAALCTVATTLAKQPGSSPGLPPAPIAALACGTTPTTTSFGGTTGAIQDAGTSTFTASVSGAGAYLWDLDLTTFITHTYAADLDITLTSPAGTTVVITTDNGGGNDDVFNGTLWDDNGNDGVVDHVYANLVLASPLTPEGRLGAFRGENPNGTWTLTVVDDAAIDTGNVNSWSMAVSTLTAAPATTTTTLTTSPNMAIPDLGMITSTQVASGLGSSISSLTLYFEIPHTYAGDLDVTLTSPTGTVVVVTTDNGAGNDNVYNGTLWDDDSTDPVTDHVYANNVIATPLAPEGSFDDFVGLNPNGTWTLTVADDAGIDVGTLVRWDLHITACGGGAGSVPFCFGDGSGTACPCGNGGAAGNGCASSVNAAGANLAGSGAASVSADSFVLTGSGMPSSSALYFQGTTQVAGGGGAGFGDGLRCAGGTVIRLGTKTNVGGTSSYPSGSAAVSVKGMDAAGASRSYQCWYRNAAVFCTPSTFNLTNGVQVTWSP